MNQATVACKWCSKPTTFLGTRECDPCHQLRLRLQIADDELICKMLDLRKEVLAFARLMEEKLRKHDARKGVRGWKEAGEAHLLDLLSDKMIDLRGNVEFLTHLDGNAQRADVASAALSVANFCMMIADVVGGLEEAAVKPPEGE